MQVDSELNIAHEWHEVTQAMRRRFWNLHTAGQGGQDDTEDAFKAWEYLIKENKDRQSGGAITSMTRNWSSGCPMRTHRTRAL
jgi:hypothetical protein